VTRAVEDELREDGIPGAAVTPDTLFRLGSTTKMMTALVALDDTAAGRIDR